MDNLSSSEQFSEGLSAQDLAFSSDSVEKVMGETLEHMSISPQTGSVEGDLDSMLVSIVESGDDKQDDQIHEITSTQMKTRTKSTNKDKNIKSGDKQVDDSLTRTTMKSGNENVKKSMKTKAEKKSIPLELKIPDFTSIKVKI